MPVHVLSQARFSSCSSKVRKVAFLHLFPEDTGVCHYKGLHEVSTDFHPKHSAVSKERQLHKKMALVKGFMDQKS